MRTKTEVPTLNEKKLTVMAGANGYQNSLLSAGYTETADAPTSILTLRPKVPGPNTLPWVVYGPDSTTTAL